MRTKRERPPAFQFYPKDFVTDEHVLTMDMSQRGVYITLLCFCWLQESIPSDRDAAAKLCGISRKEIDRVWPVVSARFYPDPENEGRLRHKRLDVEREKQQRWKEKSAEGGRSKKKPPLPNGLSLVGTKSEPYVKPREEDCKGKTEDEDSGGGAGEGYDCQQLAEKLWAIHPHPSQFGDVQRTLSAEKYKAVHPDKFDDLVVASLTAWVAYWTSSQRFPTGLVKWLESGDFARTPPSAVPPNARGPTRSSLSDGW